MLDTRTGLFSPHDKKHWLRTLCEVDYTQPVDGESLETHAPAFWRWLDRAAGFILKNGTLFWLHCLWCWLTVMTGSCFWRSLALAEVERVFLLK
nr:hypothetical protein [Escherichia coli]